MTTASVEAWSGLTAWEDVAQELAAIACDCGGSSVLETPSGAVLHYSLGQDAPAVVVDAVLRRNAAPMHAVAAERRTVAVLPSGPVTSLVLLGERALLVPISVGGELFGWWWLVGSGMAPGEKRLAWHIGALESTIALATSSADPCPVAKVLKGAGSLPAGMQGEDLYVCHVSGTRPGVGQALRRCVGPASWVAVAVGGPHSAQLLVAGPGKMVDERVGALVREAERFTGQSLAAAIVGPAREVEGLPLLAQQAALLVENAFRQGEFLTIGAARRVLVDRHLCASTQTVPLLGEDPLEALLRHDARKGTTFARALLVWLDCQGDVPSAAAQLQVHPNTLRYGVKRAGELIPEPLSDPGARLEIHLRLRHLASTSWPGNP